MDNFQPLFLMDTTTITVIGTINRDTIYPYEGIRIQSYGGILYTLIGLTSLIGERGTLHPICNLGADIHCSVLDMLAKYPHIDTEGIRVVQGKNNHAILRYSTPCHRNEFLENRVPALTFHDIEPYLNCDLVLINFISGFELTLPVLKRIRKQFRGMIYIDVHSLTLGIAEDGRRFPRCIENWEEWIRQADICQLNHEELQVFAGRALQQDEAVGQFATRLLNLGPRVVLVTLGPKGSIVAYNRGPETLWERCPASTVPVIDTTGCGDVFSAGFITDFLHSRDPVAATTFANAVAGLNCTWSGLENVYTIGHMMLRNRR